MSISPKRASDIISYLSENYPLSKHNLHHLKRARKICPNHLKLLLGPSEEINSEDFDAYSESCESCSRYEEVQVPSIPPFTKAQMVIWSKYWPCNIVQPSILPYSHSEEEKKSLEPVFLSSEAGSTQLFVAETSYLVKALNGEEVWQHSTLQCINQFKVPEEDYLCTKAVAVLFEEPCIMCAMALVHSRVKHVYFSEDSKEGAFTHHKLQERSLNYMYRIFKYQLK
jgi:hypothetical protein